MPADRDNNFNLLRVVAALAVLVSHSTVLTGGAPNAEPGRALLGLSLGSIAVDVFFVTSGFLVTASLLRRQSLLAFVWARCLRVYPANLAMVLLLVFGLGLTFTTVAWPAYLSDPQTLEYLVKNATLYVGVTFRLPGVFAHNAFPDIVNGSLWTMPHELHMYTAVALVWALCRPFARHGHAAVFRRTVIALTIIAAVLLVANDLTNPAPRENGFLMLFFMFFSGASAQLLRERVRLSQRVFWPLLGALVLSAFNKHVFFAVYLCALTYLVLFLAYVPSGLVRRYNRLGDYSYGIYIYAFPVQQVIAALLPGISRLGMVATAAPATLLLAIPSWHLLERRALAFKRRGAQPLSEETEAIPSSVIAADPHT